MKPGQTLEPHFHVANQFQLFIDGSGAFGRKDIIPFSVHYANAYTPYGPIAAGENGLSYITIRNGWDGGPKYLPKHRETLRTSGRTRRYVDPINIEFNASEAISQIFADGDDGLGGWVYRLKAGEKLTGPEPKIAGGQCWVVAEGSVEIGGKRLSRLACIFAEFGDPAITLTSGSEGGRVIMLQFPRWEH